MKKQERVALEAVVRHVAGRWETGEGPPDAYLTIARQRIAVEVAGLKPPPAGRGSVTKPGLRFDRVALGLVRRVQEGLGDAVPAGRTVILAVTAPIWQPGKTAEALEDMLRSMLARRRPGTAVTDRVHGNQIRLRVAKGRAAARVIGFVHNPEPEIDLFLDIAQSLIEGIGAKAVPAGRGGERWLVVAGQESPSRIALYRLACSQLSLLAAFDNILMVLAEGRVETLTG